jgi:nucleoside 2-deoxyribosyltransferase
MGLVQSHSEKARLTAKGWSRVEQLSQTGPNVAQAFVAMYFSAQTQNAYDHGIYRAIKDLGYEPMRIDRKEHSNKICEEIIGEIRRSRFVVADFTCEPKIVRGGVYYEAGFALGLGLKVIWTCKETSKDDLHFDTRQYNHIMWNDPDELYERLKVSIGAELGDGPNRSATSI